MIYIHPILSVPGQPTTPELVWLAQPEQEEAKEAGALGVQSQVLGFPNSASSHWISCPLRPMTRYVISSLELLVAEDYMIVYLNGATPRRRMPGIGWLKKCYQMIDRR